MTGEDLVRIHNDRKDLLSFLREGIKDGNHRDTEKSFQFPLRRKKRVDIDILLQRFKIIEKEVKVCL